MDWELFPYQKQALENITAILYLLYKTNNRQFTNSDLQIDKSELYRLYQEYGLNEKIADQLAIKKEDENFEFLSKYFLTAEQTEIPFQTFINRAAFWMATGCGKTLVMVKLIVILAHLMNKKLIPSKDILILAPKDEILSLIKEHVSIFNKGTEIKINLRNLKEWERIKNQQAVFSTSEVNVFYYRADNIGDIETIAKKKDGQRINYETVLNNGNWYLILDEAHKGEKETSKRQQYFMALTQNGFLFNFSATFTDELDKVTTVFDYKLNTFLNEGYGKKIYIADTEFRNFNKIKQRDYSEDDKKSIIAQTLMVFSIVKKHFNQLRNIKQNLYHPPLLMTLANSVNTEESDLKMFYQLLADIARDKFSFVKAKELLIKKLEKQKRYMFGLGELDENIIAELRNLTKSEFFVSVFHTIKKGNIEVTKFQDNNRELIFKHIAADKYFMLIVASDIIKWEDNVLEGYQWGKSVEESFFQDINKRNDINILLGSRIFSEGWDSNRPNIINFINIGVSDEAQKYVLQSIGRGIRIEPLPNQRKRFEYIDKASLTYTDINSITNINQISESLFVFATNKEVVKTILEQLESQSTEWIRVHGIKKNEKINEEKLPIFIPVFKDGGLNDKPFWIGQNEYKEVSTLVKRAGPKVLLLKNGVRLHTYNKVSDEVNFKIDTRRRRRTAENILLIADNYFNEHTLKLDKIKVLDGEISHFQEVRSDIGRDEIEMLERDILKILKPRLSEKEIDIMFDDGKISRDKYKELVKDSARIENLEVLNNYLDFEIIEEHYYKPILYRRNTADFQHIIKHDSEIDFLLKFIDYSNQLDNKYDWWYFSKIDEAIDNIGIPYFDEDKGKYRLFYPDYIFWLKKNEHYSIKFIDPKGKIFTKNPAMKIAGYEEFRDDFQKMKDNKIEKIDLYYYNKEQPSEEIREEVREYWTDDFNKIFSED